MIKKDDMTCKDECFYGSEGHCGRTRYEYFTHCEKLYWSGLRQRGYPNEPQEIMEPQPVQPTTTVA
jgi:hypothetical protein